MTQKRRNLSRSQADRAKVVKGLSPWVKYSAVVSLLVFDCLDLGPSDHIGMQTFEDILQFPAYQIASYFWYHIQKSRQGMNNIVSAVCKRMSKVYPANYQNATIYNKKVTKEEVEPFLLTLVCMPLLG